MRHCYYYCFYLSTAFIKKMNKSNPIPDFSSIALLSLLMSLNFFTILSVLKLYGIGISTNSNLYIIMGLIIWGINYLMLNKRSEEILAFHERANTTKQNNWQFVI